MWNEFYAEYNIINARARPAALIMKACSKARFSREELDLESVL